ncbi:MAG TPA: hypothetical protein VFR63_01420, partial [Gaiellaceae bacterium]|nr:hypothetical protein [Gaiellaceae bacterium]
MLLLARQLEPRRTAAALGVAVGLLVLLGALGALHDDGRVLWIFRRSALGTFRLAHEGERGLSLPWLVGGALLAAAAAFAWAVAVREPQAARRRALVGYAVVLAVLAVEKTFAVHEV